VNHRYVNVMLILGRIGTPVIFA